MSGPTLFTLFADAARSPQAGPAIESGPRQIGYGALYERVDRLASALMPALSRPGGIAISLRDGVATLEAFLACAALGRPAMPLDPTLPADLVGRLFERHDFAAIIADAPPGDIADVPLVQPEIAGSGTVCGFTPSDDTDAAFYWGLTSGTTGTPKLFARSHASWTASFEAAEQVFSFPPQSRVLVPGPLHHSLFLYGAIHALCRGHTVILPEGQFRPNRLRGAAARASHLYVVPFMLSEMLKWQVPAPQLKTVFSGGAKLSPELRATCEQAWPGVDLVEFYGASETSFVTFHSTARRAPAGSVGRTFPGVAIEVRDEAGTPLPQGQEGEVFVAGAMLFSGYVGEEPARHWFSVGDMGFLDAEDCLHLTGRANRMIKSRGLKIHPEPIEAALLALPEIARAAVVDLPDELRGAVPVAVVEFTGSHRLGRAELSAHCRESLSRQHCPQRFFVAEQLPLTPSGKIGIATLRAALHARDAAIEELS